MRRPKRMDEPNSWPRANLRRLEIHERREDVLAEVVVRRRGQVADGLVQASELHGVVRLEEG